MMYEGMSVEEMELAVFDLECEGCADCPFAKVCGEHELFWGCVVWEESMGEDLQGSFLLGFKTNIYSFPGIRNKHMFVLVRRFSGAVC